MPTYNPDYNKTKIYYIAVGDDCYYGHTTMSLAKRRNCHQGDFVAKPHRKIYKAMREAGMDQYNITLVHVEDYPCANRYEATLREKYWKNRGGTLNQIEPVVTPEERKRNRTEQSRRHRERDPEATAIYQRAYRKAHKDHIKANKKRYAEENKETIRAKQKAYREANKEEIKAKKADEYIRHKDRYKASREAWTAANKERKRASDKAYYETNKGRILAQQREYYARTKATKTNE